MTLQEIDQRLARGAGRRLNHAEQRLVDRHEGVQRLVERECVPSGASRASASARRAASAAVTEVWVRLVVPAGRGAWE